MKREHREYSDDEARDTPGAVIGAVAAGTGALPFLAVYATIFIIHGGFRHVVPPDITDSNRGELLAGIISLAIFVVTLLGVLWLLNGHRRWLFVLSQAGLLGVSIDFLVDPTKGGRVVSGLIVVTSFIALVLAAHPQAWEHVGLRCPGWVGALFGRRPPKRAKMPAGSAATSDTTPTSARSIPHPPE